MRARFESVYKGLDGKCHAVFICPDEIAEDFAALQDDDVELTVKRARRKRSLSANAYFWVLLDKLSERMRIPKPELYRELIRSVGGASTTVECRNDAVDELVGGWQRQGLGWTVEKYPSRNHGFTIVTLYYGSSTFDSAQMAALIDALVSECKLFGIETLTDAELAALLSGSQSEPERGAEKRRN